MRLHHVVDRLEALAPLHLAESWDNVGLLTGAADADVTRVLLTIDTTSAVLDEAERLGAQLVLSYHPLLLKPVRRLHAGDPLYRATRAGIAVYSPHTALDAAAGGTNDTLAELAGVTGRSPLRPHRPAEGLHKLVLYVPPHAQAKVADAIFAAGAGSLGAYERCKFVVDGHGSFVPGPRASPTDGEVGRESRVEERRLELLVRPKDTAKVLAALRAAHPYEEPVYDVTTLWPEPLAVGQGRVGTLTDADCELRLPALAQRLRERANLAHVRYAAAAAKDAPVRRLAFAAGAGDGLVDDARREGADVLVTGELRHHTLLACLASGLSVVLLGHDGSERPTLARLQKRLRGALDGVLVDCSEADASRLVALS